MRKAEFTALENIIFPMYIKKTGGMKHGKRKFLRCCTEKNAVGEMTKDIFYGSWMNGCLYPFYQFIRKAKVGVKHYFGNTVVYAH